MCCACLRQRIDRAASQVFRADGSVLYDAGRAVMVLLRLIVHQFGQRRP